MDPEQTEYYEDIGDVNINAAELLKNPQMMAAVQAKLNGLVGESDCCRDSKKTGGCCPSQRERLNWSLAHTGFIETLPNCIKKRLNALKNIQVECAQLEGKFYEEAHQLEMKYAELFKPLYDKRTNIVNGSYEPNEEEAVWVEPGEDDEEDKIEEDEKSTEKSAEKTEEEKLAEGLKNQMNLDENTKGIPEFWLTAMKNVELIAEMIQEHDDEVLKHLTDVKLIFTGKGDGEVTDESEMGFVLEFQFETNDFFTNTALTKTYRMKSEPDKDDPFSFDGPDIFACSGCKIDWKKGKNITQKQVKKKQKHKGRGQTRVITKMVHNESFFNFFDPPEVPENEDDLDEETEALLAVDFEIGHFFRERLIPKAVLFYTGEAIEEDSDEEDDDQETSSEEEEEDDEIDEDDPDFKPSSNPNEKPEECKQQ